MSGSAPVLSVPVCEGGLGPARRIGPRPLRLAAGAYRRWERVTRAGQYALLAAYYDAVDGARPGAVLSMPRVPEGTHPLTVAALVRRGLVADGVLTPLAVEVLAVVERPLRRPVETRRPVGDLL